MFTLDFEKPIHIHFIGIGGISMSGLAELLMKRGFTVSGSDRQESDLTRKLASMGAVIHYSQVASNLTDDIDLVVYTAAIHPGNEEYDAAVNAGIPMMDRAELLGQLSATYPVSIGVSGTHGKTTTTGMLATILMEAGQDPTVSLGGKMASLGGNLRIGNSKEFLFEACEYTNSFLKFHPSDALILNIDADHLDFFKDLDDIRHSFRLFADKVEEGGRLIINGEIPNIDRFLDGYHGTVDTYGILPEGVAPSDSPYRYTAANITFDGFGCASYDLYRDGVLETRVKLSVPGIHNVSDSLAAASEGFARGVSAEMIARALSDFSGTERRFEKKGVRNGVTVVDDYAHHPTEIAATLKAALGVPHNRLFVVFQPHTYTRTLKLRNEFVDALSHADVVVLADIYAAREKDNKEISSANLADDLRKLGKDAYYFPTFEKIIDFLKEKCVNEDLLITMGAGNVVNVGISFLKS
ncbi:MAG: UDP-N-acetylmuramate--L-alanine ligase [Lachnospiraceae bacterium]|nr:UDP-N-acetylmuramate--L-alanine ligase [Lachnospiraceae bacterium]